MKRVIVIGLMAIVALTGCGNGEERSSQAPPKAPEVGLNEAVLVRNNAAISQHIAAGSNLNEKDAYGSTPLIVAATFGATDAAKILIDGGADLHIPNNEGSTPLHIAALLCYTDIVKALIEAGVDRERKNGAGHTAFDAVAGPFADMKPMYDGLAAALGPMGLKLDYKQIEETRPVIATMLKS